MLVLVYLYIGIRKVLLRGALLLLPELSQESQSGCMKAPFSASSAYWAPRHPFQAGSRHGYSLADRRVSQ